MRRMLAWDDVEDIALLVADVAWFLCLLALPWAAWELLATIGGAT